MPKHCTSIAASLSLDMIACISERILPDAETMSDSTEQERETLEFEHHAELKAWQRSAASPRYNKRTNRMSWPACKVDIGPRDPRKALCSL